MTALSDALPGVASIANRLGHPVAATGGSSSNVGDCSWLNHVLKSQEQWTGLTYLEQLPASNYGSKDNIKIRG
jgi:hypothetical protein